MFALSLSKNLNSALRKIDFFISDFCSRHFQDGFTNDI